MERSKVWYCGSSGGTQLALNERTSNTLSHCPHSRSATRLVDSSLPGKKAFEQPEWQAAVRMQANDLTRVIG